jgi:hypothetical protein
LKFFKVIFVFLLALGGRGYCFDSLGGRLTQLVVWGDINNGVVV